MKKISKASLAAVGQKRTYSTASALCYTSFTRPMRTLGQMGETFKQKRFKRYTPSESEFNLFEPWEFEK